MTPQEIEGLAKVLAHHGIAECEVSDDRGGVAVKLVLRAEATEPTSLRPQTEKAIARPHSEGVNVLRSPGMGCFSSQHPFLEHSTVIPGQAIEVGGLVGFLVAGPMITEIRAARAGVLGKQLVDEGQLIGFADAVFEMN